MTELEKRQEENLRQGFKQFNKFMLAMWRLGLGPFLNIWPDVFGRIMVLTHTGRNTRLRRRTPLNYAVVNGEVYCTAGFGTISDWYRNILVYPHVEIWLPDSWWAGTAVDVTEDETALHKMRQVIIASGFAGRLAGLDACRMSDEEFAEATRDYRLIHIQREQARTGRSGPGDLAWVWPLATILLLPLLFRRRK